MKKSKYIYSQCEIKAKNRYDLCVKINRRLRRGDRVLCYEAFGYLTSAGLHNYLVTIETLHD